MPLRCCARPMWSPCTETGVRIEGSNSFHWVFRCNDAVVHQASPTRGAVVIRDMMDGHRPAGLVVGSLFRPNRAMREPSRPAWRIWRVTSPSPMKRARDSSCRCGSSCGFNWPGGPHRNACPGDDHRQTTRLGASDPHRHPRNPDFLQSGARSPEQVQTSARPASHLRKVARPGRRLKQRLRARPQAIGDPAQGHQRLSRYVGGGRRSGHPHRRRHGTAPARHQRLPDHSPDRQRLTPPKLAWVITLCFPEIQLDLIGRLENLPADLLRLEDLLDTRLKKLKTEIETAAPTTNASKRIQDFYTPVIADLVRERYKMDFLDLGYALDLPV